MTVNADQDPGEWKLIKINKQTWFPTIQKGFCPFKAVLRIHDILVWIRIRGSMPLTNGSGSFYLYH